MTLTEKYNVFKEEHAEGIQKAKNAAKVAAFGVGCYIVGKFVGIFKTCVAVAKIANEAAEAAPDVVADVVESATESL